MFKVEFQAEKLKIKSFLKSLRIANLPTCQPPNFQPAII